MRDLTEHGVDQYRARTPWVLQHFGTYGDGTCGVFGVPSLIDRRLLRVIAASGFGWEHVSVSRVKRTPTWGEMEHIKRLFFRDDETVMQLHVPSGEHINCHPYCLHLWRPLDVEIPRPPRVMVGPSATELQQSETLRRWNVELTKA